MTPVRKTTKPRPRSRKPKAPAIKPGDYRVSVLGAGNWGSTIANLIGNNGYDVLLWCRRPEQADEINQRHTNERYLPGIKFSRRVRATVELKHAVLGLPLMFFVVPSKSFREVCRAAGGLLTPDQQVVHATKGFEAGTHARMSEVISQETCVKQLGVLSGPNIAPEIAAGKPAGTVVASRFPRVVRSALELLVSPVFRVYMGHDVVGVELAGALKNVVAIAGGIATELGLGENAKALLVTRGLAEMKRLGEALGAEVVTFGGVAGLGDLIVTCASPISRNHRVGAGLARGMTLEQVVESLGMVAEGVNTAAVTHEIIKELGIYAPVFEGVYRMVHEGQPPAEALDRLMRLETRPDVD